MLVPPPLASRARIERDDVIEGERHVHHTVGQDRGGLEGRGHPALVNPARHEPLHVRRVDAGEGGEALVAVVAAVGEPARWLRRRGEQACVVNVRRQRDRAHQQSEHPGQDPPDHVPLLLDADLLRGSSRYRQPDRLGTPSRLPLLGGRRAPRRRLADPAASGRLRR